MALESVFPDESGIEETFDPQTYAEAFRHKMIHFRKRHKLLVVLVSLGILNLVVVAGFKIFNQYLHLHLAMLQLGADTFPLVFFWYAAATLPFAFSCIVTAALHSHFMPRTLILGALIALGSVFIPQLVQFPQQSFAVQGFQVALIAIVAAYIWRGWSVYRHNRPFYKQARKQQKSDRIIITDPVFAQHRRQSQMRTMALMYPLIAGYFYAALWFYHTTHSEGIIYANFHATLVILGLCLIPVYLLAGSDYGDFAEIVANRLLVKANAPNLHVRVFWASVLCCAALIVFDSVLLHDVNGMVFGVQVAIVVVGAVGWWLPAAITWIGQMREGKRTTIPIGVIFLGMVVASFALGMSIVTGNPWLGLSLTLVCFMVIVIALLWLASQMQPILYDPIGALAQATKIPNDVKYRAMAVTFLGIVILVSSFSVARLQDHAGLEAFVAPIILLTLFCMVVRGSINAPNKVILAALFSLSASTLVLTLFYTFFLLVARQGEVFSIIGTLLVMGALSWDLIASGEMLENDSRDFPRGTRFLYLVGYIIMATVVLNFLAEVRLQTPIVTAIPTLSFFDRYFDHVPWVLTGVLILGIPTLMTHFFMDVGHGLRYRKDNRRNRSARVSAPVGAQRKQPRG